VLHTTIIIITIIMIINSSSSSSYRVAVAPVELLGEQK
jgi:uncharacterized protein YpmB